MRKLKNKLKHKLVPHFDKALDFSMPMLLGTLVASAILVSCDAKSSEVENVHDIMKADVGDRTCLVMNLYHESRSDSDMANIMVLNSVFNRVKSKNFPNTPCGVIKQKLQYSWSSDGRDDLMKDKYQIKRLTKLVDKYILNKELFLSLSQGVDHYHHVNITPEWSTSPRMKKITTIDNHTFYKRK